MTLFNGRMGETLKNSEIKILNVLLLLEIETLSCMQHYFKFTESIFCFLRDYKK